MPVITIRGQLGSGATQIGKACAEALSIDYVDRDIINRIAERLQRSRLEIITKEILPTTIIERIARALSGDFGNANNTKKKKPKHRTTALDKAHYLRGLKSVIRELARSDAVVIRGRGSQFFLRKYPNILHVLTIAPLETRLKRVMESLNIDEEAAKKKINRYDSIRRVFIKQYFDADIEEPMHYDIVINTENVSLEAAVSMIIEAETKKHKVLHTI